MKMTLEDKSEWIAALRNGEYEQGHGALAKQAPDGQFRFCCLGVFCDLQAKKGVIRKELVADRSGFDGVFMFCGGNYSAPGDRNYLVLPWGLAERISSSAANPRVLVKHLPLWHRIKYKIITFREGPKELRHLVSLAYLNDSLELSFSQIADVLEKAIEVIPEYPK
jgi:hypothetical protein